MAISISLQYGVPLETYVQKFTNMKFEPAGLTDDPDIRMSQSIMDYIFRRLALDHLTFEQRAALGIYSAEERRRQLDTGSYEPVGRLRRRSARGGVAEGGTRGRSGGRRRPVGRRPRAGGRDRSPRARGRAHHRRAVRGDHRLGRRRPAVRDVRDEDAAGGFVLRLRGLREYQRLQLSWRTCSRRGGGQRINIPVALATRMSIRSQPPAGQPARNSSYRSSSRTRSGRASRARGNTITGRALAVAQRAHRAP